MQLTRRRRCSDLKSPKPTCYTKKELIELALAWNSKNKNNKIINIRSLSKQLLWKELRLRNKTIHEDKWIKGGKTRRLRKSFAPLVPKEWLNEPNQWLSDEDLFEAMKAYEKRFKKFLFLYPAPIDFDTKDNVGRCAYSQLCNYSYSELEKKYDQFGAIFNTDPHNKPGQHWIAMFIDFKKREISFFDSIGDEPPKEVYKLLQRFHDEGTSKNEDPIKININRKRHQYGSTECGVYCLFFIHHMLTNGDFEKLSKQRITDEQIMKFRGYFFDDIHGIYN